MLHLLHHDSVEDLAELVFGAVDRATDVGNPTDAPQITRDLFDVREREVSDLIKIPEFRAVCAAVDLLIEDGSVHFDTDDGSLHRV
jgi:hypothetical protein